MPKLTNKQAAFCREYVKDRNATQAAIRAGYSEHTAEQYGYQLLQKTSVNQEITRLEAEHAKECAVTVEGLTAELNEALSMAKTANNSAAATQAILAKAKLHGLLVDKQEVKTDERFVVRAPEKAMTSAEWEKHAASVLNVTADKAEQDENKHLN